MLSETKESSDLGGSLGTGAFGVDHISETWDFALALLDDGKSQNRKILTDNTATDGRALAFTGSSGAITGVAVGEEELDTSREHL